MINYLYILASLLVNRTKIADYFLTRVKIVKIVFFLLINVFSQQSPFLLMNNPSPPSFIHVPKSSVTIFLHSVVYLTNKCFISFFLPTKYPYLHHRVKHHFMNLFRKHMNYHTKKMLAYQILSCFFFFFEKYMYLHNNCKMI